MPSAVDRDDAGAADGHASISGMLRAEFRWSTAEVTHRRRMARLVDDLPDVMEALWSGEIGVAQVRALGKARNNPRCGYRVHRDTTGAWHTYRPDGTELGAAA